MVLAAQGANEGTDAMNILQDSVLKAGPLMAKMGWTGVGGLEKYLSYVHILSQELGGIAPAVSVLDEMIAGIGGTKTKAKFAQAFGKGYDIAAEVRAAQRRGADPFKFYIDKAIEAEKRGVKIFQSPEQVSAMESFRRRGRAVTDTLDDMKTKSKGAVDKSLKEDFTTLQFKIDQLKVSWDVFTTAFGAVYDTPPMLAARKSLGGSDEYFTEKMKI
jgi:hypothetical protein